MIDFVVFALFLWLGHRFRTSDFVVAHTSILKQSSVAILLLFVSLSLWRFGVPAGAWWLIGVGVLIQAVPALLSLVSDSAKHRAALLIFSTYGGGNRGSLALSLLAPWLLPIFILIDLGNFLSLVLLFPWIVRRQHLRGRVQARSFGALPWTIAAVAFGVTSASLWPGSELASRLLVPVKYLLVALTSVQIGLALKFDHACLRWTVRNMLLVRLVALAVAASLLFAVPEPNWREPFYVLCLFALLPVSSLVVSMLPDNVAQDFEKQVSCSVAASTLLFVVLLGIAATIRYFTLPSAA